MNLPNKLTLSRIFMIPIFIAVFYIKVIPYNMLISAFIFLLAAFTDFLDGKIARKYNLVTTFGKFLDPIADKILVATALILLLVPKNGYNLMTEYGAIAVSVILARELMISGFRLVAASKGKTISADLAGKIKTFVTDIAIVVLLISAQFIGTGFGNAVNLAGIILLAISTVLTVYSGVLCLIKNKEVLKD